MIRTLLLLNFLFANLCLHAQRFDWVSTGGSALTFANSYQGTIDIARNNNGELYTMDFANFGQQCQGDTVYPYPGTNTFLYKFNENGELLHMMAIGDYAVALNIEVDDENGVYLLVENRSNMIIINDDSIPAIAFRNYLIKLNGITFELEWIYNTNHFGNFEACFFEYSSGYLYVQSGNLSIVRLNTDGEEISALSADYYSTPTAITSIPFKGSSVFPNGDLLICAAPYGDIAYGSDTLFALDNPFLTIPYFFMRCDTAMNVIWTKYFQGFRDPDHNLIPVAIDEQDGIYVGVEVSDTCIVGNDTIIWNPSSWKGGLLKMDGNGNGEWARDFGSNATTAWALLPSSDGNGAILAGQVVFTATFGDMPISSDDGSSFIAAVDAEGEFQNAYAFISGPVGSIALALAPGEGANYHVGGKLNNSTTPVFACTEAIANKGFYLSEFNFEPSEVPIPEISVSDGVLLTASPDFSGEIQWFLNDLPISGANEQSYLATENGEYSVTYTYSTGCVGSENSNVQIISITGIDQIEKEKPIIYPNPFSDVITIQVPFIKSSALITITDNLGRIVLHEKTCSPENRIHVENLPTGLYIVNLLTDDEEFHIPLLKRKSH